jgi:signal transduction histidine kinase/ABC-type amino acid transport substrate-binding protein
MKNFSKRFLYGAAKLCGLLAAFLIFCSFKQSKNDTIVFLGDRYYAPFEFVDNQGNPAGFDVDLTNHLMKKLGIGNYKIVSLPWQQILKYYDKHPSSVIMGMNMSKSRESKYNFGPVHNYLIHSIVYRKGEGPYEKLSQLQNKKIVVETGSFPDEFLAELGLYNESVHVDDVGIGLKTLSEGKYDAMVCVRGIALYYMDSLKIRNLEYKNLDIPNQKYCYVGRDSVLMFRLDTALNNMRADGSFDGLKDKWLSPVLSGNWIPKFVYIFFVIFIVCALILAIFIFLLKHRVHISRAELDRRNRQLALALSAGDVTVWGYDVKSKRFFNIECDYFPPEGRPFEEEMKFFHPDDVQLFKDTMRSVIAGEEAPKKLCFRLDHSLSGNWQYTEKEFASIRDRRGKVVTVIGTHRDVTQAVMMRKSLEEEMERAQEADKLKSAFVANMSHEIRTPLNAIVGFSNLLQEESDPEEREEFVNLINSNSDLLLRIINDILDLSKMEAGMVKIEKGEFDMSACFDGVISSLKNRVKAPVELVACNPYKKCVVLSDKNRVAQVLTNFITNAIKYTPSGTITASYVYENSGLKISVEDTGIGIAEDKQHLIFQRFEKLDTFAQGTGLGLSICKAIVESCGGKIGFDSKESQGSTFWAIIPCQIADIEEVQR